MVEKKEIKVEETDLEDIEVAGEVKTEKMENEGTGKGLSIASLILGICSIVLLKYFFITLACGILAIIFGIKGRKREGKGMAAAGFITGIIGVSLQVLFFLFGFFIGLVIGLSFM